MSTPENRQKARENGRKGGEASARVRRKWRTVDYGKGYNAGWQQGRRYGWAEALGERRRSRRSGETRTEA